MDTRKSKLTKAGFIYKGADGMPDSFITQEHINMPEFGSQELSAEMEFESDLASVMDDKEYVHAIIESVVKDILAEKSQQIIDLAISTYILNRKNRKLERRSFELVSTKKSVSTNK